MTENTVWWCLNLTDRTFFLDQHGCAKNQVDGELIITRLLNMGFTRTSAPEKADLIIVNSCGFIESAKKESLASVMEARAAFPRAKILLAGCLAERYAQDFTENLPEADGILGNGDLALTDSAVEDLFKGKRPVIKAPQRGVACGERTELLSFAGSAFVKITEGCDNRCSFCAIPLIRGRLRSRNPDEVTAEIKSLLGRGIFEINLIGQDLASYGCGETDCGFSSPDGSSALCSLLKKISALEGTFWLRLLYIHPDHFDSGILDVMKSDPRILPYFDIPFQSGDDSIIRAMNRKGSFSSYSSLVKRIREEIPHSCIRTTFLAGFPGETEENAQASVQFLKEIESDWSGCFCYSREEGTSAFKMKHQVPQKTARKRAEQLERLQAEITARRLQERCGKVYDVLVEEIIESTDNADEGLAVGRAWFEAPEVDGSFVIHYDRSDKSAAQNIRPGSIVKVQAAASLGVDIDGEYAG